MPSNSRPPSTITIEAHGEGTRVYTKSRASSGGSASVRSHPSHGSGGSGFSESTNSGSWSDLGNDEIEPSDSASRSRQPVARRYTTESRPEPTRRHSSRRSIIQEREEEPRHRRRSPHRHRSSRARRADSHRTPSEESSLGTVASQDDYPYPGHHGMPPPRGYPPQAGYRHVPAPGHGGYAPSIATPGPGYHDGYGVRGQALVHVPQQDPYGYPVGPGNPFSPQDQQSNPFSPMSSGGSSYFQMDPHAPPMPQHHHRPAGPQRPQSYVAPSSHYGSEMMSPYGHPGMPPPIPPGVHPGMHPGMSQYGGYAMGPMPGYGMPWYHGPPSMQSSPAPPSESKESSKKDTEGLELLLKKTQEAQEAWHAQRLAAEKEAAAAAAEKKAKEEEEKKRKEEVAAASTKAKEAAEKKAEEAAKKAKEEHDKKLKELETAKEEALKKQKELEEQAEKLKPPDHAGKSIKFKDVLDRKYSFPFHLCKTWKTMQGLINQAFTQVDGIGDHVRAGHYDLHGPDGEIILPQVWDTVIQPDWEITMALWPLPEEKPKKGRHGHGHDDLEDLLDPLGSLGLGDLDHLGIADPGGKRSKGVKTSGSKKKAGRGDANVITVGPRDRPPVPPMHYPAGVLPDPLGAAFGVEVVKDKSKSKAKKPSNSGWASFFAGGSAPPRSKKDSEKLDLARHKSERSVSSVRSSVRSNSTTTTSAKRNSERVGACAVM